MTSTGLSPQGARMQKCDEVERPVSHHEDMPIRPVPSTSLEALRGRDVVVVSPQYWCDYWVSKHWIAHELARQLRTVFIEPPVWVGGVVKAPWTNRAHVARLARPLRKLHRNLYVLSPKLLPAPVERWVGSTNEHIVEVLQRGAEALD